MHIPIKVGSINILEFLKHFQTVFDELISLANRENPAKQSGYLAALDANSGIVQLSLEVGKPPSENSRKYYNLAHEKARRLRRHDGHLSSYQSRNAVDKWGGAILASSTILSFSGLTELEDEALMLELAFQLNLLNFDDLNAIARFSDNKVLFQLHDALQKHKSRA